jgi:ribosomal protein S10
LEIKKEIGAGAFKRWNEFTHRMIIESKKTKEQVLEELKKYGLKEEIAIKFIALYYD